MGQLDNHLENEVKLDPYLIHSLDKLISNFKNVYVNMAMQNGTATLENILAVSYRDKHTLTIWPSYSIPILKRNEIICSHKKIWILYWLSLIHQKLETTKISFNWWMDKQTVVRSYYGTLLNNCGLYIQ